MFVDAIPTIAKTTYNKPGMRFAIMPSIISGTMERSIIICPRFVCAFSLTRLVNSRRASSLAALSPSSAMSDVLSEISDIALSSKSSISLLASVFSVFR